MKKYYVYKLTNKYNGKIYIGEHGSEDIENDKYDGSGSILPDVRKKYGKDWFIREILHVFDTKQEALAKEKKNCNSRICCR